MRTRIIFPFILIASCCVTTSFAQVSSTFDTDADGWTFSDAVVHDPGGYISSTYSASATSSTQYWSAPSKFLGNHVVKSAGMNLKFDLQQSVAGTSSHANGDVRIESPGFTLVYSFPVKPATAPGWTTYELKLDETAGWRINSTTGSLATRSQVMNVITNITAIEIRASYATQNPYTAAIDNVILEERTLVAAPSITAFSPVSGDVGSTVTITGANFSPVAGDNVVYFGSTCATVLSATSGEVVVSVPAGAAFAPLTLVNTANGLSGSSQHQFTPTFPGGGRLIRASFDPRADILLATPGNDPTGLSLNDVDGDGWNDIVVSESGNVVSIYRNLGGGGDLTAASFASPVSMTGGGNSRSLRVQDLDGDGNLDIAAEYSSGSVTYFATFRNTSAPGNIAFEAVELWPGLVYSGSLSHVVDVDGDGRPDLIGQHGNGSVSPDFWIAENISTPGDIEFGGSRSYFGGSTLDAGAGVTAGDLDNDGKPEIIVEHAFGGQFQIIKNNSSPGAISFGTPFAIAEGVSGEIQVFDINEDGNLDLIWKKGSNNDDINVRINSNNDGVLDATDFATEVMFNSDLFNYGATAFSDLNGDGKADIFATDGTYMGVYENVFSGGTFNSSAFVEAYLHQGTGTSTYPDFTTAADLNGDGRPDIVSAITNITPARLVVYENKNLDRPVISVNTVFPLKGVPGTEVTITGDNFSTAPSENLVRFGSIQASVQSATETQLVVIVPAGVTTGYVSVTRDGLSSRYHLPFVATFSTGVDFAGTHFSTPVSFTLAGADYDVEVADLDNDGKADVVAEATGGRGYAFMNTHTSGAITTGSLTPDDTTSSSAQNVRLIDLDADGYEDIVSINGMYRNTSNGGEIKFEPLTGTTTGGNHGFGDFNHDGKTDIVGVNSSVVVVTENRTTPGNYSTASPTQSFEGYNYGKPAANGGSAAGDFDNDGLMDFAATNPGSDNLTVWRNMGSYRITTTQFSEQTTIPVGDNPGRLYASDVDVDGKIDLVLYYSATTTSQFITVLHNQSTVGNISFTRV
ncbi:MAG TPA: FG-GAP-like repeat-containing protein, partial [Chryseosolibacter sp.]|nr:FG-GAP-like repeat-containing protein [Chryseosolibacter sp.]